MTCLKTFLKSRYCKDKTFTHVSLEEPKGRFLIQKNMKEFWNVYQNETKDKHLAERQQDETPILVDVDIKKKSPCEEIYTQDDVKYLVSVYQKNLKTIVKDLNPENLLCILLEKSSSILKLGGEEYIKHGFHLHFPKLFLTKIAQRVYLLPNVIKDLESEGKFPANSIDSNSLNVNWLMYGSKKQGGEPYKATCCFTDEAKRISLEDGLRDYILVDLETNQRTKCGDNVINLLPQILSVFLHQRKEYFFRHNETVTTPIIAKFQTKTKKDFQELTATENLEEASELINMISDSRAGEYTTWLAVGFALWNISSGDLSGLMQWLSFSEKSPKFDEATCIYKWDTMEKTNATIGTLKYYAKQDSKEAYDAWIKNRNENFVDKILKGGEVHVAKLLYNSYSDEFVCTDLKNKKWYVFDHGKWEITQQGTLLRARISDQNCCLLKSLEQKYYASSDKFIDENADASEVTVSKSIIDNISKVIYKCTTTAFKNSVLVECQELFFDANFENILNKNPDLIAFQNGVYDLKNNIFREGKPEDYISTNLPINYIDYKTPDHPDVMLVRDFFQKIFPDDEIRDYFFDQMKRVFHGGNRDKTVFFWVGVGDNGKSITQSLFEKMLGPLAIKFNTTVLTGKKPNMSAPNAELARAGNGVRWAVVDELNPDEAINSGVLKLLTGNDSFFARDLYEAGKNSKETVPMFKLHVVCNQPPPIKQADKATCNRIRVIPFESVFAPREECKPTIEEQIEEKKFPVVKDLDKDIPNMTSPLAWYLLYLSRRLADLPYIPKKVAWATQKYVESNDFYKKFETYYINDGGSIKEEVLIDAFKEYFKEEYPGYHSPTKTTIIDQFNIMWGKNHNGKWSGKSIKNKGKSNIIDSSDEDSD